MIIVILRCIGCLAQVIAESSEVVKRNTQKLMSQDIAIKGPEGYILAHTEDTEMEGTFRACTLAYQMNCPLYLSFISSPATAKIISSRKAKGQVVFGEVTPAALACNDISYWEKDWKTAASLVTSPPIRKEHCSDLAKILSEEDEGIDLVGSNHKTFNSKQKALGLLTILPIIQDGTVNISFTVRFRRLDKNPYWSQRCRRKVVRDLEPRIS